MNREAATELALLLFGEGAVLIETGPGKGFRLAIHDHEPTRPLSPFYFNLRTRKNPKPGPLDETAVSFIAKLLYEYIKAENLSFGALCGVPNAGDPFAQALAVHILQVEGRNVPILPLEKQVSKEDGRIGFSMLHVDRDIGNITRVLLIDDLITHASSKLGAIEAIEQAGFSIENVLVILDREQGGSQELAIHKPGYMLHALLGLREIFGILHSRGKVSSEELLIIRNYLAYDSLQ